MKASLERFAFWIPGDPVGKKNAKYRDKAGEWHNTPKSAAYAKTVKTHSAAALAELGIRRLSDDADPVFQKGDISVSLEFFVSIRSRSDTGNLDEIVLDALQGIAYKNDSQIHGANALTISRFRPRDASFETLLPGGRQPRETGVYITVYRNA